MKIILNLLVILLIIPACERTFDSADIGFELPEEPPVPTGLVIFHQSDGIMLEWQILDTAVVDYFKIYYSDNDEAGYLLWDITSSFNLTITALNPGREYFFRVTAVSLDGAESNLSLAVSTVVGATSMTINGDDFYTNSERVSLRFTFPSEPLTVKLSEDPLLGDAIWRSFSQPASFSLTSGDGPKFVYAIFQFADGSESSEAVSDSIILDTRAMIDSAWFIADSTPLSAGDTVTFFVDAGEPGGEASISFPTVSNLDIYDDGTNGDVTAADGIYSRYYVVPVSLEVDEGVVTARFTDAAGNRAADASAPTLINIVMPIGPITLWAVAQSSSSIRLDWTEVIAGDFISYRIYRDIVTGVDESSDLAAVILSPSTVAFTDDGLDANQSYYYKLYAFGSAGLLTSSLEAMAITSDNPAPDSVSLALSLGDVDGLTIILSWGESDVDDFGSYQIYRGDLPSVSDITGQRIAVIHDQSQTTFSDHRTSISNIYYYVIYVYDQQGLISPRSNVVVTP